MFYRRQRVRVHRVDLVGRVQVLGAAPLVPHPGPTAVPTRPNVLGEFVATGVRPWDRIAVPLARSSTCALWLVMAGDTPLLGWLLAVHARRVACSGPACDVVMLFGHPTAQLLLTVGAFAMLAGCAAFTRGLTRADSWQLALMTVAALAGSIALLGVLALAAALAAALALAGTVVVFVVDRV